VKALAAALATGLILVGAGYAKTYDAKADLETRVATLEQQVATLTTTQGAIQTDLATLRGTLAGTTARVAAGRVYALNCLAFFVPVRQYSGYHVTYGNGHTSNNESALDEVNPQRARADYYLAGTQKPAVCEAAYKTLVKTK
jgi:hypothetical protein